MRNRFSAVLIILCLMPAARADILHVAGAGSLAAAFTDLLRRFPAGPDTVATPEFGPSGLMREKIEGGADVDLFASADMAQARRLAIGHPERFVVNFTRNRRDEDTSWHRNSISSPARSMPWSSLDRRAPC